MLKQYSQLLPASFWRRKVNFVIAGTQKGGTSALGAYLRRHPHIGMPERREVHFFDNERVFQSPLKRHFAYAIYHAHFDPRPEHRISGERTPIYMYWMDAPPRMWHYNPDLKLIIILRDPSLRAYSHWNMERHRGAEKLSFGEAIRREAERCREALPWQHRVFSYVDRGFYTHQLRRLWMYFPRRQTLILRNEELRAHPNETLRVVTDFLDVDPLPPVKPRNIHSTPYASAMAPRERKQLLRIYEYEIKALQRLLGWDCRAWVRPEYDNTRPIYQRS